MLTTSGSTTPPGNSRPPARHSTMAPGKPGMTTSYSCTRMSTYTRWRRWRRRPPCSPMTRASSCWVRWITGASSAACADGSSWRANPHTGQSPSTASTKCLLMTPRRLLERQPLSDEHEVAWHAYAVDFGLRVRALGLRVCAVDIPITHNSLTINVDRLDVAYDALAAKHPNAMPVMTPQGRIGGPRSLADRISAVPGLGAHRWRYRWLRESLHARAGSYAAGGSPCLRGDIRIDVDDLLAGLQTATPLLVLNIDQHSTFVDERTDSLALTRADRPIRLMSRPREQVGSAIARLASGGPLLMTNLRLADVRSMASSTSLIGVSWASTRSSTGWCSALLTLRCRQHGGRGGQRP